MDSIKTYFEKNASCLNVRGIELRAGVPAKTLDHFLKGRRSLSIESAAKISAVLSKLNYKCLPKGAGGKTNTRSAAD